MRGMSCPKPCPSPRLTAQHESDRALGQEMSEISLAGSGWAPQSADSSFPDSETASRLEETMPASAAPVKSSLLTGTLNLLNTIIGGGILSLPYAFRSGGMVVGMLELAVFGGMSWYGSWLLLTSLRERPEKSFEGLAHSALGKGGWVAYNVAALLNCFGACISYIIVVADVLVPLSVEFGVPISRPVLLTAVVALLIFPLCAMRDISSLRYASATAIGIYSAFVVCLIALWAGGGGAGGDGGGDGGEEAAADGDGEEATTAAGAAVAFKPGVDGILRAIPLCAFAFMCQTSLFPIYQETREPTEPRMLRLTTAAFGVAACIYLLTGVAAYAHFGEATQGDVLLNLVPIDSAAVRLIRLGFGISICLTYPCLHFAARRSLEQLLFQSPETARKAAAGGAADASPYGRLLLLTVGIVGTTLVIGIALERVEVVFGFTGAVASTALSYCLPAAIHLRLRPKPLLAARNAGGLALLVVGALLGLIAFGNHAANVFARR